MSSRSKLLFNYVVYITSQLKWALNYLLLQSFFSHPTYNFIVSDINNVITPRDELSVRRFREEEVKSSSSLSLSLSSVECAVCLCKIEDGEEVRELKCEHLFHKVCLDRWMGYGRKTCPLCRNYLKSPTVYSEINQEVIVLDLFPRKSRRNRCEWWLR
ncbi:hypothetical protein R3W88_010670 [Solanum pinnatisectum]|uniref:RING-type domain-containing protein n=1 Tax=Solanum pinnatisectum TaxID=50273 RepID=A0AAV9L520_9SOLN|nr:hypothetical protein R3W88_010670 [Solanum pinnatisectum]